MLALPFFVLAWLSGRLPRITGLLLLGVTAFFFLFFGIGRGGPESMIEGTFIFILGPLLASGIALLSAGEDEDPAADA